MSQCPHCQLNTIGYFAKQASWRGGPVQCPNCKGLSFLPKQSTSWGRAAGITPFLLPLVLIFAGSWWAVGAVAVLFVALVVAHEVALYRAPLIATTASEVAYSRKWAYGFVALVLIGAAIAVSVGWHAT
jgi:hypothetical protein